MKSTSFALACVLITVAGIVGWAAGEKPPPADQSKLIVHEWGTFLSVQGSDGMTLGGMIDSEEELPPFVQTRNAAAWERAKIRQRLGYKMETPVTYFYTDRPRSVRVRVGMPEGILTHWFPTVRDFGPSLLKTASASEFFASKESFLDWGRVELIPDQGTGRNGPAGLLRPVSASDTWRFARMTDAAFVKVIAGEGNGNRVIYDHEKFLFYRGLGAFQLPLQVRSHGSGESMELTLLNTGTQPLEHVFAVEVGRDRVRFARFDDLGPGAVRRFAVRSVWKQPLPLGEGVVQAKEAVRASLQEAGLYAKESQAMVDTWESSYFRTEGLRILYTLPRETVDEVIPIQIKPAPDQLVRVMVGRVEVLTPDKERQVEQWLGELISEDPSLRGAARIALNRLGRLREPVLRRIALLTKDPAVRSKAEALINERGPAE